MQSCESDAKLGNMLIGNAANKRGGKAERKKDPGLDSGFSKWSKSPGKKEKKNRLFAKERANVWKWPKTKQRGTKRGSHPPLFAGNAGKQQWVITELEKKRKKRTPPPNSCSERGGSAVKQGADRRRDISTNNTNTATTFSLGHPLLSKWQRDPRSGFHGSSSSLSETFFFSFFCTS